MTETTSAGPAVPGSASLRQPDYWWYRARAQLLESALGGFLGRPSQVLDVGSADGPSVGWMAGPHRRFTIDVDPRGLRPGDSVCASALALPFRDAVFDVVGAFDVLEHCEPEQQAMDELVRVLAPGGRLLMSVPAYQWAWTDHDIVAGHHRRYTQPRLEAVVREAGLTVLRSTYAFAGVFGFFVAERAARRVRPRPATGATQLTPVPAGIDRVLMGLSGLERRLLASHDMWFGSSVLLAAQKPAAHKQGTPP
jgi:SAM-dependent methyltransferase